MRVQEDPQMVWGLHHLYVQPFVVEWVEGRNETTNNETSETKQKKKKSMLESLESLESLTDRHCLSNGRLALHSSPPAHLALRYRDELTTNKHNPPL
jgi:hypothetical protein